MAQPVTQPRKSLWPWIIGGLVAFAVLAILQVNTMDSEERIRYEQWKSTLPHCIFNPDREAPMSVPCISGDKIYTK